jgi:rubrerythrin
VAFAVKTEELGAELYQELARKFAADVELRELFEQLGRDEVDHAQQIRAMGAMERKHVVRVTALLVGATMLGGLADSA